MLKILVGVGKDKRIGRVLEVNEYVVKKMTKELKKKVAALKCYYEWDKKKGKMYLVIDEDNISFEDFEKFVEYLNTLVGFY